MIIVFSHAHPSIGKGAAEVTMMRMTRLVSPSHFLASRFIEWGVPKRQLAVIENGLAGYVPPPPTADKPPPLRAASSLPWQRSEAAPRAVQTVFGYFGQINPFKGIDQIRGR